jgi:hypothetical protein
MMPTINLRAGKPPARLLSVTGPPCFARRVLGIMGVQMRISDDFDASLPDDLMDAFEAPLSAPSGCLPRTKPWPNTRNR